MNFLSSIWFLIAYIAKRLSYSFEKMYRSTAGRQKVKMSLPTSFPKLYCELNDCTVSLTTQMMPSIGWGRRAADSLSDLYCRWKPSKYY